MGGERQEREDRWRTLGVSVSISGGGKEGTCFEWARPVPAKDPGTDDPPPAAVPGGGVCRLL